jgi:titin
MSFFRTHRAQVLRSEQCRSTDIAVCNTFRRIGINPIVYVNKVTVPTAPSIVSSSFSGTTLSITFTPGSPGANPITNYEYSLDNSRTFQAFSPAVTISPLTITGLTAGETYSIFIRAVNANGKGNKSSVLSVTTPTTPSAPTGLTYTTSTTSAIISFTPGPNGGSAVTNYRYSTNGGTSFTEFSPAVTTSPVNITGLSPGITYSMALQAVNAVGNSTASSNISVTTLTTIPSAPSSLSSSNINSDSVTISFTPGSDGGSSITNYQYSTDGGTSFTEFSPEVTSSPVTISGLSSGTTYSIVIKPINTNGAGGNSPALSVTTA